MAFVGHAWLLECGQVAYRDFAAAWGPVAQALSRLGVALGPAAPLDAVPMVYFVLRAAGSFLLALWICFIPVPHAGWAVLPTVAFAWSLQFASHGSFRIGAALLALRAAAAAMSASGRIPWTRVVLAGGLFVVAALCSVDVFAYAFGALVVGTVVLTARAETARRSDLIRRSGAVALAIAAVLLLVLGVFAGTATDSEQSLFEPARRVIERAATYSQVFGLPTRMPPALLGAWSLLTAFAAVGTWRVASCSDEASRCDLVLLGSFSLLLVKSAITRADDWHVSFGLTGILAFLALLPSAFVRSRAERRVAQLAFVGALVAWPGSFSTTARPGGESLGPVESWRSLTRRATNPELVPNRLLEIAQGARGPVFVFPTQIGLAAAARRPLVAPVDQVYAAHTIAMQRRVADEIRGAGSDLMVILGLDGGRSWQIDKVQSIARSPVIAEMLLAEFVPVSGSVLDGGFLLLSRRDRPRTLPWRPVAFRAGRSGSALAAEFDRREHCSLLRLHLALDYAATARLGWAGGIVATGKSGARRVLRSRIVALESGAPFSILMSPLHGEQLAGVFEDGGPVAAPAIDRMILEPEDPGPFGVRPRRIELSGVDCLDSTVR
jgi:hypothetical protein